MSIVRLESVLELIVHFSPVAIPHKYLTASRATTPSIGSRSEPRLAFNKIFRGVVPHFLREAHFESSTINLRLAALQHLAYEAADAGLLSPDLAAGIRRVKGAKKYGTRAGNWFTVEQGRSLLPGFDRALPRGNRDDAMVAVLLGCGLPRAESVAARIQDLQQRAGPSCNGTFQG